MAPPEAGLTIGASIAARRAARMPCIADGCDAGGRQLLDQVVRTGAVLERIACGCGRTWRRIWVGGYGA